HAVAVFAVKRPVAPTDTGVVVEELDDALEPLRLHSFDGGGAVGGGGDGDSELAEPYGGDVFLADIGPVFGPDGVEGGVGHGGVQPRLGGFDGPVVVGGVDELVGDGEADGCG